jgi:hypothetical protein
LFLLGLVSAYSAIVSKGGLRLLAEIEMLQLIRALRPHITEHGTHSLPVLLQVPRV